MIIPSRTRSLLLPEAPCFAQRRGLRCWIANLLIQYRGRRDAAQPIDEHGMQPTILSMHRIVDQEASKIDDALQQRLTVLDSQIAHLLRRSASHHATIEQHRTETTRLSNANDPSAESHGGDLHHDETARRIRHLQNDLDRLKQALNDCDSQAAQLEQERIHLPTAARDIAASWSARCDQLSALHRRGYNRKTDQTDQTDQAIIPRHASSYSWANSSAPATGGATPGN